jgi:glycosyltransferase involved in cell wall biosynthesis
MKIAVDLGAYSLSDGGISRYIGCMLEEMLAPPASPQHWYLYGRGPALQRFSQVRHATLRSDGLPPNIGRIASLCTSLAYWSHTDRPDVFWGPAHRLPLHLPASTARVVTIHDLCWLKAPQTMRTTTRWLDHLLMPRAIAQADKVVVVSHATARDVREAFPAAAAKVVVIAEGASPLPRPDVMSALRTLGVEGPFILFVGTLEPRKNLARLLDAFALLCKGRATAPLLVIAGGTGWGHQALQAKCRSLGTAAHVRLLGRVSDQVLSTLYRHALFLAMPSLYEGFGLPLVEAMAQGTPVLTSNTASMPEVAGDAGLLVDPLSSASIHQGLLAMVNDTALRQRKADAALGQAELFSWSRSGQATLDVLRQAVETRQRTVSR